MSGQTGEIPTREQFDDLARDIYSHWRAGEPAANEHLMEEYIARTDTLLDAHDIALKALDASISREEVLRDMAKWLATNPNEFIAEAGGARYLAILAISRCYTQEVLEDGSCFDPYTARPADSPLERWVGDADNT